jgi:hypothetical protein
MKGATRKWIEDKCRVTKVLWKLRGARIDGGCKNEKKTRYDVELMTIFRNMETWVQFVYKMTPASCVVRR